MALIAGVLASALMFGTDAFGRRPVKVLDFPAQVSAVALLLLATLIRHRELGSAERVVAAPTAEDGGRIRAAVPVAGCARLPRR